MAQLRDAQTGEVVAEGDPIMLAELADAAGLAAGVVGVGETPAGLDLMYDDVGLGFDTVAVRQACADNLEHLPGEAGAAFQARVAGARSSADAVKAVLESVRDRKRENRPPVIAV